LVDKDGNLLPTMRAWIAWDNFLMDQLVSMEISNPSRLRTTVRIAANIGCMHCIFSMPVQEVEGIKLEAALCAVEFKVTMTPLEMCIDTGRHNPLRAFLDGTAE
jgi:hypothetical protein